MRVVPAVPSGAYHFGVCLVDFRFFCEFCLKFGEHAVHGTLEEPAYEAEREHVLALEHGLLVEAASFERALYELRHRHEKHATLVDSEFLDRVIGSVLGLFEVGRAERVAVADDYSG